MGGFFLRYRRCFVGSPLAGALNAAVEIVVPTRDDAMFFHQTLYGTQFQTLCLGAAARAAPTGESP